MGPFPLRRRKVGARADSRPSDSRARWTRARTRSPASADSTARALAPLRADRTGRYRPRRRSLALEDRRKVARTSGAGATLTEVEADVADVGGIDGDEEVGTAMKVGAGVVDMAAEVDVATGINALTSLGWKYSCGITHATGKGASAALASRARAGGRGSCPGRRATLGR